MSLPSDIQPKHIKRVLHAVDAGALTIPKNRAIKRYELRDHGRKYPPKFVISHAGSSVGGIIAPDRFGGGTEANNFLIRRGFVIWNRETNTRINVEAVSEDDARSFPEGSRRYKLHHSRERNARVAKAAKDRRLRETGELLCDVCGFSFRKRYGDLGDGFIEAHHTVPVSQLRRGASTKLADIALVCSNCHRMLHRKRPWLRMGELKVILKRSSRSRK